MEHNVVIRDFPLGCRGPSANSWCLGWLAQRPQDLRHIYAELLPRSTLLSKYLSHISGIWCSSRDFSPLKSCFYWIFAKLAGCSKLNIYLLFYCQFVSHHMSLDAFMQITTGSLKPDKDLQNKHCCHSPDFSEPQHWLTSGTWKTTKISSN